MLQYYYDEAWKQTGKFEYAGDKGDIRTMEFVKAVTTFCLYMYLSNKLAYNVY